MRTLIRKGRLINPKTKTDDVLDLYIENAMISDIAPDLSNYLGSADLRIIDAEGLIVSPGLVDIHCHLRDPGFEYKEDIASGTRSAAMGGFTSVACMPNTDPVADNLTVISYILNRAKQAGAVHVFPIGAITRGLEGNELAPIGELKVSGAVAVSDDGRPVMNGNIMKNAMIYANMFDVPVISHCEDINLADGGVINDGLMSAALGLKGITAAAEDAMVAREIVLSDTTGTPVHIAHVSTRGSVNLIRDAKRRGIRVTCETCPHYFSLTEEACADFNTSAKMNPPLRTPEDVEAVIEALNDGTIDAIATDHAPHHADEKEAEFELAPNGIIGFETALSVAITYLYRTGRMSMMQILECLTSKPASVLRLDKGEIKIGGMADIVIFDPEVRRILKTEDIVSKATNSPYIGKELYGAVVATLVNGEPVVLNGELMV